MTTQEGSGNPYPHDQCTWWACERYHQLTNHWACSWFGNAATWYENAIAAGWNVSASPPNVPSICVQQPFTQGAFGLGHVSVVESVNGDGTVTTSNSNYAGHVYPDIIQVKVHTGVGVSFIWVGGGSLGSNVMTQPLSASLGLPNIPDIPGAIQNTADQVASMWKLYQVVTTLFSNPVRILKMAAGILLVVGSLCIAVSSSGGLTETAEQAAKKTQSPSLTPTARGLAEAKSGKVIPDD